MSTCAPDRPARMYQSGRTEDQVFALTERLYMRFAPSALHDGSISAANIPFHVDASANRSRYSFPEDALYPNYFGPYGVFSFSVADLPDPLATDGITTYDWRPYHAPEDTNYAHSEIRTHKQGVFSRDMKVGPTVKKHFRETLEDHSRVDILPGGGVHNILDTRLPPLESDG